MRWPVWLRFLLSYALVFLPLYLPLMTGRFIYGAGDTLGFDYPPLLTLQPFSIDSLLSDSLSGQGFPWLVTYGTLDPIAHVLRIFFDAYQTLGWLIYIYLVVGSFFFALLLRRHRFSDIASFAGGLVFTCAFFWIADGDYPLAFSVPLFSSLLFILSFARSNPWRSAITTGLMVGYGWLAGHFNYTPLILTGCGAYVCYQVWTDRRAGWKCSTPLFVLGLGTVGGTLIGLFKLIPALAYVQLSTRAGGLSVAAASTMTLPFSALYTAFFPYMRLPLLPGDTGVLFYGAMGLGFALVGVFSGDKRVRPLVLAWVLIVIITLPYSPFYALIQHLPFFSFLRTPYRWMFLAHACVAVFLAAGMDWYLKQERSTLVRRIGVGFLLLACVSFFISGVLAIADATFHQQIIDRLLAFFDAHLLSKTSGLPLEHYHAYVAETWSNLVVQWSLFSPRFLTPFLGIVLTGIFFVTHQRSKSFLIFLTICTTMSALFFYHPHTPRSDIERTRHLYEASLVHGARVMPVMPAFADFALRSTLHGERSEERVPYQLSLLVPNTQALTGMESIDFYQPIQTSRMGRILAALGSDNAPAPSDERIALSKIPLEEKLRIIAERAPLVAKLGVEYMVSGWDLPSPFKKAGSIRPIERLPAIAFYTVPHAQNFVTALMSITIKKPDEAAAVSFLTHMPDIYQDLLECNKCSVHGQDALHASFNILQNEPTEVSVRVEVKQETWMMIRRARLPGYRVFIDGEPTKTAIANGLYPGIPVPAGDHIVTMKITYPWLLEDSWKFLMTKQDPQLL